MIGLVYLAWAPLGPEPVRDFLRSYCRHPAGAEHELVILLNGSPEDGAAAALPAELADVRHRLQVLDRPVLDLPAYGLAARELDHDRLCLLNSYSQILADGWLGLLDGALGEPGVGLAGASGSWESQAEWIRGQRRYWLYQLALLPRARRDYPRFPNPHLRTTAFVAERRVLLGLGLDGALDKRATYLLESGPGSITRQVQGRGQRVVVVGRDGWAYDVADWPRSATYRAGGQHNLLVADRRTRDWEQASPWLKRRLMRDAWGGGRGVVSQTPAEITDPGGRSVVLDLDAWQHITDQHPEMAGHRADIITTVTMPEHSGEDPRPHRQRYWRSGAGPSCWLMVVVDFGGVPARIVTAYGNRKDPPDWKS